MGKRSIEPETWILIACAVTFVLFMLYVLTGCSQTKKAEGKKMMWHDGQCLFVAEGLSVTEAKSIMKEWQFKECEVLMKGSTTANGKKPLEKEE